jgi:hypothetical protein
MEPIQTPPEGTEEQVIAPVTATETETPQIPDEDPQPVVPQDPVEPEQPSTESPPAAPEGFVPKDKFVNSARESILNAERIKARDAQLNQLTKTDTPTDEAMRLLYPDWDDLNEWTKKAFINQEAQNMRQHRIELQQQEITNRQKLDDELETVIDGNPKLAGQSAAFKRFAKKPENRGIPAETLAKAFLYDGEDAVAPVAAPTTPSEPVQASSEALPSGNGGPRDPLTPKKISIEEAAEIRKTDYKRYKELVDTNQIEEIE